MPINTLAEVKTFLQISASTYDSLITSLLPITENAIINYCNNHFIDTYKSLLGITPTVYMYDDAFEFINSDNSLNNSNLDFTTYEFNVGDNVRVYNSLNNNKVFKISSIAANKIIFDSGITVIDEDNDNNLVIGRVKYPDDLKLIQSDMIGWRLEQKGRYFKSEKIDDYSYTRDDKLIAGYPQGIMDQLNEYRSIYLKQIPSNILYYRQA